MNLNETIICYKKIAEANRDSYVCLLETSYQNQMQNKAIMDRHKRKAEEYEQLAEWLEELQSLRSASELWEHNNNLAYQQGREDAIDDFAEKYKKSNVVPQVYERIFRMVQFSEDDFSPTTSYIDKLYCDLADDVAEQLKEGDADNEL